MRSCLAEPVRSDLDLSKIGVSGLCGVRSRVCLSLQRRLARYAAQGEVVDICELSGGPRDGHDCLRLLEGLLVLHLKQRLLLVGKISATSTC